MNDRPVEEPGTGAEASAVLWPLGPHYFELTGSTGAIAWVRYRVWAADWYTRTLRDLVGSDGDYDRLVGIEMALDGALNSLSGAFDAATALVIQAAEDRLDVETSDRLPVHRYKWGEARDLLKGAIGTGPDGTSDEVVWRVILDVDSALAGDTDPYPIGWLAQLRRSRNDVAHHDTLARHHGIGGPTRVSALGGRETDAFMYLARACDQVHDLTEEMTSLAVHIGAPEIYAGRTRSPWFRIEPPPDSAGYGSRSTRTRP